jgi:dTDP-4-dehydrorhamnose 3,5-epimerase
MNDARARDRRVVGEGQFELIATGLPGCLEIRPRLFADARGRFVKVFHRAAFASAGLATEFAEEYYSVSRRGVIRGLHFQRPPRDHAKLVYCVAGRVQDAVVELSAEVGNMLYIPNGLAHGFCVLSDAATLVYKVTSVYSSEHDAGIRWDSAGIPWAETAPILSERDRQHPALVDFATPFIYRAGP